MRAVFLSGSVCVVACSSVAPRASSTEAVVETIFDSSAVLEGDHFFDRPYPSDLRKTASGGPDLAGFPNPRGLAIVSDIKGVASERIGFFVMPVGYFRFTATLPTIEPSTVWNAEPTSALMLVDVDPTSNERGRLFPVVAQTIEGDIYLPDHSLAIAARPGIILSPGRTYAFVVRTRIGKTEIRPSADFSALARGEGSSAQIANMKPLWVTLDTLGVARSSVAAAAVFTTGDAVRDMHAISESMRKKYAFDVTDVRPGERRGSPRRSLRATLDSGSSQ